MTRNTGLVVLSLPSRSLFREGFDTLTSVVKRGSKREKGYKKKGPEQVLVIYYVTDRVPSTSHS